MPGQVSVGMMLRDDGTVNILAQATDVGVSDLRRTFQVVADELGMNYSDVSMRHNRNVLFAVAESAGSMGGQRTYPAMVRAARKLKRIILEHAVKPRPGMMFIDGGRGNQAFFPGKKPEIWEIKNSMILKKPLRRNKSKSGISSRRLWE